MLISVKKLLEGAEKENEDIPHQKVNLEKKKLDLQVLALSLEGGMLDRKKSLQVAEKYFELLVEKEKKITRGIICL